MPRRGTARKVGAGGEHGAEAERLNALIWLKQKAAECADEKELARQDGCEPKNAQVAMNWACARSRGLPQAPSTFCSPRTADRKRAGNQSETMVKIFHVVGVARPGG